MALYQVAIPKVCTNLRLLLLLEHAVHGVMLPGLQLGRLATIVSQNHSQHAKGIRGGIIALDSEPE